MAQALGHIVKELSLSYSTIRRAMQEIREAVSAATKVLFTPSDPFILHWDGELSLYIVSGKQKVNRITILVTGGGVEKLFGILVFSLQLLESAEGRDSKICSESAGNSLLNFGPVFKNTGPTLTSEFSQSAMINSLTLIISSKFFKRFWNTMRESNKKSVTQE